MRETTNSVLDSKALGLLEISERWIQARLLLGNTGEDQPIGRGKETTGIYNNRFGVGLDPLSLRQHSSPGTIQQLRQADQQSEAFSDSR